MKSLCISLFSFLLFPIATYAQSTTCHPDFLGGFTCSSSPQTGAHIDLGAFQRGVDAANQQAIMERQLAIQRQLMEQQRQMSIQQQMLNQSNSELNIPEWQIGNLSTREEGKLPNGMSRCVYHSPNDYFFIQGKRFGAYATSVEKDQRCPLSLHVSKSTGDFR